MAGASNLLQMLFSYCVALLRRLEVLWIRFHKFLLQPDYLVNASSATEHKVVVVGDGFAEGLGDFFFPLVSVAGVASTLEAMCTPGQGDNNIRQRWQVYNRGRIGTSTHDWLPSKPLYERIFGGRSKFEDAEIVIIMLGSTDVAQGTHRLPVSAFSKQAYDFTEEDWAETTRNLVALSTHLREKGKHVIMTDIPTEGSTLSHHTGVIRRINRQINKYVKSVNNSKNKHDKAEARADSKLQLGRLELVKLSDYRIQKAEFRSYDGFYLNHKGYKSLAFIIFEHLAPMIRAVEWSSWKELLAPEPPHQQPEKATAGQAHHS